MFPRTSPEREKPPRRGGGGYSNLNRPDGGVDVPGGSGIKIINCVIHANKQGIGFWGGVSGESEIYGNLIYDNGWKGAKRSHGTGIYGQNRSADWRYIRDNIVFDNYGFGMKITGSANAQMDNYHIARNIFFAGPNATSDASRTMIGSYHSEKVSKHIKVLNNIHYNTSFDIGYSGGLDDAVVTGNTFVKGSPTFKCTNLTASKNFVWQKGWVKPKVDGENSAPPKGPLVFLNPNAYDSDRANLAIIAFKGQTKADVDASSFLKEGDTFQIRDPRNFYEKPVFEGMVTGNSVSIPLAGEFTCYVMLKLEVSETEKQFAAAGRLIEQKNYIAAAKLLKKIRRTARGPQARKKAATLLKELRSDPEIKQILDQVEKETEAAKALKGADKLHAAKKYGKALKRYEKIFAEYPGTPSGKAAGEKAAAIRSDEKLLAKIRDQAAGTECRRLMGLAKTFIVNKKPDKGRTYLQKIIDKYPDTEYAKQAEKQLKDLK